MQLEWQFSRKATIELTHNWGTESDPNFKGYHSGNEEPQGYGHIGVAVPDVAAACKRFSDLGMHTILSVPAAGKRFSDLDMHTLLSASANWLCTCNFDLKLV